MAHYKDTNKKFLDADMTAICKVSTDYILEECVVVLLLRFLSYDCLFHVGKKLIKQLNGC